MMRWLWSVTIGLVIRCWNCLQQFVRRRTSTAVTFPDSGKLVYLGRKIAEGGFSFVFEAHDADHHSSSSATSTTVTVLEPPYALKRVHCPDWELVDACRREAAVHRAVSHPHLMPLLDIVFQSTHNNNSKNIKNKNDCCYMLFPFVSVSLRQVVNQRNAAFLQPQNHNATTAIAPPILPRVDDSAPWKSECTALRLFGQICAGVQAMHDQGYSHRDIKLENVLVQKQQQQRRHRRQRTNQPDDDDDDSVFIYHPILMDFGSAGPTVVSVPTRRAALEIAEQATLHTTLPYRPPELWEGGLSYGSPVVVELLLPSSSSSSSTPPTTAPTSLFSSSINDTTTPENNTMMQLDYRAVDVWSLACTLHAMLYGASPFECEFTPPHHQRHHHHHHHTRGSGNGGMKIVECTHLSVLGDIPTPPPQSVMSTWYSSPIRTRLLEPMLAKDPAQRPTLPAVIDILHDLTTVAGMDDDTHGTSTPNEEPTGSRFFRDHEHEVDKHNFPLMSRMV